MKTRSWCFWTSGDGAGEVGVEEALEGVASNYPELCVKLSTLCVAKHHITADLLTVCVV